MKQIALRGRIFLRRLLTVLSIGAVAVTFQACYGVPMVSITGTVKAAGTEEPIPGIQISIDKVDNYYETSDDEGNFELFMESWAFKKEYKRIILFKDIDGPENGGEFQDKEIIVDTKVDQFHYLNVFLDQK